MSSPQRSWSETTIACASANCSRNHGFIIAVSSGRPQRFSVYQRGRGHDPVTVAGSITSLVAVNAIGTSFPRLLSQAILLPSWQRGRGSARRPEPPADPAPPAPAGRRARRYSRRSRQPSRAPRDGRSANARAHRSGVPRRARPVRALLRARRAGAVQRHLHGDVRRGAHDPPGGDADDGEDGVPARPRLAVDRVRLFRLAWDTCLSAFAGRQALYEYFFFGDPVRMAGALVASYDREPYKQRVRDFLRRE